MSDTVATRFYATYVNYDEELPRALTRAQVADCVLLFGYRHDGCVPVDTHCYQLAQRWLLRSIRDRPLASAYQVRLSSPSPTPSP